MRTSKLLKKHPRLVALNQSGISQKDYFEHIRQQMQSRPVAPAASGEIVQAIQDLCSGSSAGENNFLKSEDLDLSWVSFAEHHSSMSHPETTNVVANLATFAGGPGARIITLSCGTTPLDNELFPRGLVYEETKIPLMSHRQRRKPVLTAEPWDMAEARTRLEKALAQNTDDLSSRSEAIDWFESVSGDLEGLPQLWQQISVLNAKLGQSIFAEGGIQYTQVPMELVASRVLTQWLANGVENWVTGILTDTERFKAAVKVLDGTDGFFNIPAGRGTVFLWQRTDQALQACGQGSSTQVVRPAAEWVEVLASNALIPSAGLAMIVLGLYLGIPNFGGLLQYDYLADARLRLLQPASGLTEDDRDLLAKTQDSYYVNFERRSATRGGLRRLADPIVWEELERESELSMGAHTEDCLAWLLSSFRGGDARRVQ